MGRRSGLGLVVALLATVALWNLGQGIWIHVKAHVAQRLLQQAWARTIAGEREVKPWPWADTWPVARLRVPAHGVDLIVLDGVSGRTLAFGPGHVASSAPPGHAGTALVTGHRDTHFRFLARLKPGEQVLLEAPGQASRRYVVRDIAVVDSRAAVIRTGDDVNRLVLITCYPFDAIVPGGPLRYVVAAEAASG